MGNPYLTATCSQCGGVMDRRTKRGICKQCLLKNLAQPVERLKSSDWAYIAGLFDGEGCFSLNRWHDQFRVNVIVSMTDSSALDWIAARIPYAHLYHLARRTKSGKAVTVLSITSYNCAGDFIRCVLPYLKVKRNVASAVLEYCEKHITQRGNGHTRTIVPDWEVAIWHRVRALNQSKNSKLHLNLSF